MKQLFVAALLRFAPKLSGCSARASAPNLGGISGNQWPRLSNTANAHFQATGTSIKARRFRRAYP